MRAEPYLLLGGVEIANALRTLTYLRRGLAGGGFEVTLQNPLAVAEGGGYSDIYSDEYDYYLDSYRTRNLRCYCRTIDTGPYQDPAFDDAPWYDAGRPESAEFLGMVLDVTVAPVASRPVTRRVGFGGSIGAVSLSPRLVQASGTMYASSRAGMAYGERWLSRALTGTSGCGADVLTILPACAGDDVEDDDAYLRQLAGVGLIDGPLLEPLDPNIAECLIQSVAFQLAAADPFLRLVTVAYEAALDPAAEHCVTLTADEVAADVAAVLTFTSGAGELDGVVVTATVGSETATFTVADMPANSTLVIDSSRRVVDLTDADGLSVGGLDVVDFDGVFPWFTAGASEAIEVCVDATGASFAAAATVRVDQVDREL